MSEVLTGFRHFDELSDEEQAIIRVEWAEQVEFTRSRPNLADEFTVVGRPYVELDADGRVVRRDVTTSS